jgi:tetratricopeptide (TPR) repeat protein
MVWAFVVFELLGQVLPPGRASVTLHGSTTPFSTSTLADDRGRFRIRDLEPGPYTLSAFVPARGEARRTVEVGPGSAGTDGRVQITIEVSESAEARTRGATVSMRELAVPDRARREYAEAQKKLGRRDTSAAIAHLEKALEIAPEFCAAWNNLGTIAYQTGRYPEAEVYFRRGLQADPQAFEPLVNLGGALLTLQKLDQALRYNLYAVLVRPGDALANSQLGMTYFATGNFDLARKYLESAKQLDPAHFSHPQIVLAGIHMREKRFRAAAAELEDFLARHPDSKEAAKMREAAARLKSLR